MKRKSLRKQNIQARLVGKMSKLDSYLSRQSGQCGSGRAGSEHVEQGDRGRPRMAVPATTKQRRRPERS